MGSRPHTHFVVFPFMAQGHTIPLLHLARLLHRHSAAVTVVTTPANAAPIRAALQDLPISILEIPFPRNIPGVPPGVENTHNLPFEYFLPFANSTKLLQKPFEQALENLQPPVSCIVSDGFLAWTLDSANKFGIPRLVSFGMGMFACTMYQVLTRDRPHVNTKSPDEKFIVPGFGDLKLTRNDFQPPFNEIEPSGEYCDFMRENIVAMAMSYGMVVNSFDDMDGSYVDYWNEKIGPKAFCVGPLCLSAATAEKKSSEVDKFLDEKLSEGARVLFVAFGTQAEFSDEQLAAIATGLERSEVSFVWALNPNGSEFLLNFIERTKDRGLVAEGWVDQIRILNHGVVGGFLSHCGWNSVIESITAGVPIVALPLMVDQHLNARFVAEVAGVGVRAMPAGGESVRGFVEAAEVEKAVREVMGDGEKGTAVREKMMELGAAARGAMQEGGSSRRTLDKLIEEVGKYRVN